MLKTWLKHLRNFEKTINYFATNNISFIVFNYRYCQNLIIK